MHYQELQHLVLFTETQRRQEWEASLCCPPTLLGKLVTSHTLCVNSYTHVSAFLRFITTELLHTEGRCSKKPKVKLPFYGYCWITFLNMKVWHGNVFLIQKWKSKFKRKLIIGWSCQRRQWFRCYTKGASQTESTVKATTVYVYVLVHSAIMKNAKKYVRLFSKVLGQWNTNLLQEKEPKLWYCPSIYFTCMDNLYMPHTVCTGFANKQTVIAATITHTVTSHSTQRIL